MEYFLFESRQKFCTDQSVPFLKYRGTFLVEKVPSKVLFLMKSTFKGTFLMKKGTFFDQNISICTKRHQF